MKQQTFNDGLVNIYQLDSEEKLVLKIGPLRYQELVVGLTRFWVARQLKVQVDKLIRIQRLSEISTRDVAVLGDGSQFLIKQIQLKTDLPVVDLSLEIILYPYQLKVVVHDG